MPEGNNGMDTTINDIVTEARAQFAADGEANYPAEVTAAYDEMRALQTMIAAESATIASATRRQTRAKREGRDITRYDAEIADANARIELLKGFSAKAQERVDAWRAEREAAKRVVINRTTAYILEDYGRVVMDDNGRPTHVEFTPTGPDADGNTYAIVVRGDYSFEVGLRSTDEKRFFVFGYDVDVYAPRHDWANAVTPSMVNWGAIGATTTADVRAYARLLRYAADIADRVNDIVVGDAPVNVD